MDIKKNLKITSLINLLKNTNDNKQCDANVLKNELNKLDEFENKIYDVNIKENDELLMIYANNIYHTPSHPHALIYNIEEELKSFILDKITMEPIITMFNKIIYNQNGIYYLQHVNNWDDVVVSECYSGTILMIYNHNDKWNISTRTCLDATFSNWNKHISHKQMFIDALYPKKIEDFDPKLCYYFILTHNRSETIVMPTKEKLILHMVIKKDTFEQIDINIYKDEYALPKIEKCDNFRDVIKLLEKINRDNIENQQITTEGLIIKIKQNGLVTILKLDTEIYFNLRCVMGNFNNKYITYINIYKNNAMHYFFDAIGSTKKNKIIKKIDNIFKTLSADLFYLYKETKIKKNREIYDYLLPAFKKSLYEIHKIYLDSHFNRNVYETISSQNLHANSGKRLLSQELMIPKESSAFGETKNNNKFITYYDIYGYLKNINTSQMAILLQQRYMMKDTPIYDKRNNDIFKYFV